MGVGLFGRKLPAEEAGQAERYKGIILKARCMQIAWSQALLKVQNWAADTFIRRLGISGMCRSAQLST